MKTYEIFLLELYKKARVGWFGIGAEREEFFKKIGLNYSEVCEVVERGLDPEPKPEVVSEKPKRKALAKKKKV